VGIDFKIVIPHPGVFELHAVGCTGQAVDKDGKEQVHVRPSLPPATRQWGQCDLCKSLETLPNKKSPLMEDERYEAVWRFGSSKEILDEKVREAAHGVLTPFSEEETTLIHKTRSYNDVTISGKGLVMDVCLDVRDRCKGHTQFRKIFEENKKLKERYGELTGDKLLAKYHQCYREKLFNKPFLQLARWLVERLTGNTRAPLGAEWQAVVLQDLVSAHCPKAREVTTPFWRSSWLHTPGDTNSASTPNGMDVIRFRCPLQ